jgi:hypothetical protein
METIKQRPGTVAGCVAIAFFLWEHVGKISQWTFRPTVGMHKAFLLSKSMWTALGEWVTVVLHFIYNLISGLWDRIADALIWVYDNILCHLVRYLRTILSNLWTLLCDFVNWIAKFIAISELFGTLMDIVSHTWNLVSSPLYIFKGWIDSMADLRYLGVNFGLFSVCAVLISTSVVSWVAWYYYNKYFNNDIQPQQVEQPEQAEQIDPPRRTTRARAN